MEGKDALRHKEQARKEEEKLNKQFQHPNEILCVVHVTHCTKTHGELHIT